MNINQVIGHSLLEMIGVIMLTVAIAFPISFPGGSATGALVIVPFLAIAAAATAYRVTGAQFNPIVTVFHSFRKDKQDGFDLVTNLILIAAQFLGAAIGGVFSWWWSKNTLDLKPNQGGSDAADYLLAESFFYVLFGTFVISLVWFTMTGKSTTPTKDTGMQAVVVGAVHSATVFFPLGGVGGGYLHPWIDFWLSLYYSIDDDNDNEDNWDYMWINLLVPWLGAALGWAVHQFVLIPAAEKASRDPEADGKIVENQA